MPRGGFRVNQRHQLHDGPKESSAELLLALVLGADSQMSAALTRVDLDFHLPRLEERMLGRIGGDGEKVFMVHVLPGRRLAQRRETRL